ncbi:hypothetical protein BCV69DRAFT_105028 [Microstroma glucosiphilum]|uniref:Uncharacterized protein n=1 Tax=Pseudomicrostroma glucosiphilum TaxID=1684307 RepID=A0A316UDP2_9BASI|nr:hypothetical protein BCV69DRAFT_105028 [Pseudomicrostroma glucosiphilum]PWN23008.1 hypothetical protein BCV69DRAFT_105028 [Pseudomicrostroma glucosiphilum]
MSRFLRDHPIDCPGVMYTSSGWPITCLCSPSLSDLQPLPSSSGANDEEDQRATGRPTKTRRFRVKHTTRRRSTRISEQSHGTVEEAESPEASSVASSVASGSASPTHFFTRETSTSSFASSAYTAQTEEETDPVVQAAPTRNFYIGPCVWPGVYPGLPPSTDYLQDAQPDFIQPTQEMDAYPELENPFEASGPTEQEISALLEGWEDPPPQADVSPSSTLDVSGNFDQLRGSVGSHHLPLWEARQDTVLEMPFTITTQEGDVWDNGFY